MKEGTRAHRDMDTPTPSNSSCRDQRSERAHPGKFALVICYVCGGLGALITTGNHVYEEASKKNDTCLIGWGGGAHTHARTCTPSAYTHTHTHTHNAYNKL